MRNSGITAGMDFSQVLWKSVCLLSLFRTVHLLPNNSPTSHSSKDVTPVNRSIPCDEEWTLFGQHCYRLFGYRKTGYLSWKTASSQCATLGGNLASIHSKEQHDFLAFHLLFQEESTAWIGLHEGHDNKTFVWKDGSKVNFTFWTPGRPTVHDHPTNDSDCVEMRPGKRLYHYPAEWYDDNCIKMQPYICKKASNATLKSPDPLICSSGKDVGWRFRKSCFTLVNNKMSWDGAEHFCRENFEGHLVTISDLQTDWFLSYILKNFHESIWTGIKIRDEIQQKWTSGWNVAYQPEEFSTDFGDGSCVIRHHVEPPYWSSVPCHQTHPFICETTKEHPPRLKPSLEGWECPESSHQWRDLGGEFCYYFDTRSHKQWHQAHKVCHEMGGMLASILSKEESKVLHPFVKHTQDSLYIGLNSMHTEGHQNLVPYKWSDGTPPNYTHWETGKPSSSTESCVAVLTRDMRWVDVPCDQRKGYICSAKKVPHHGHRGGGKHHKGEHCLGGMSFKTLVGPICFAVALVVLLAALIYFLRPCLAEKRKNLTNRLVGDKSNDKVHLLRERPS